MFLLYLDDAGSTSNASDRYVVLAGIALFERQVHFLDVELGEIARRLVGEDEDAIEFHGSHLLPGKGYWRSIRDRAERRKLLAEALATVDRLKGKRALFAAVIDKQVVSPRDPLEVAFEQVVSRFDQFLTRINGNRRKERGLLILDKSTQETRLQQLARDFKKNGHTWGRTRNLVDVPFFVDSKATRAIQYADLVAYALWQKFSKSDDAFFKIIETAFDAVGGVRHGLYVSKSQEKEKDHA